MRKRLSTRVRQAILERHGGKCQLCRITVDARTGFELDHHIPLALGGTDTEDNLRPLCGPCHKLKTKGDLDAVARAKRRQARHLGTKAPSRNPLPGGRASKWKRKMNGTVVRRDTDYGEENDDP